LSTYGSEEGSDLRPGEQSGGRFRPYISAMGRLKLSLALTAILAMTATVNAHDFWIEPSTFHPAPGSILALRLRVGQDYIGDPLPRNNALIERFVAVRSAAAGEVIGRDGGDPAGLLRIDEPGLYVIGYRSRPSFVELQPDKLEQYINEEGLEHIRAIRARRGESGKPWREIFSRCAKSMIWTGSGPANGSSQPIHLRLEILPEKNPYALARGDRMPIQLLFEGRPLEGALITALNADDPASRVRVRTDRKGRAVLPLAIEGDWLIKAVHVIPAPPGAAAEWESLWASLTFELGGAHGH
jgi:uncharacterized GH25 family protein